LRLAAALGGLGRAATAADAASERIEMMLWSPAVVKIAFTHGCGEYRTSLPSFRARSRAIVVNILSPIELTNSSCERSMIARRATRDSKRAEARCALME
jgi:hypothetical protein